MEKFICPVCRRSFSALQNFSTHVACHARDEDFFRRQQKNRIQELLNENENYLKKIAENIESMRRIDPTAKILEELLNTKDNVSDSKIKNKACQTLNFEEKFNKYL